MTTKSENDPMSWIPKRAAVAHGLRAEAVLEEPAAPAEPAAPEGGEPVEEAPEPTSAERLEERIEAAFGGDEAEAEEGDHAEEESPEADATAPEAGTTGEGEESAAEEAAEEADTPEEEAAEDGDSDADDGDSLVLRLPGRHEDDPDVEIPLTAEQLEAAGIDVQQFTERQNQLRNGYMRGQEVRTAREEINAERSELDFIYNELQRDPAEFVAGTVNPTHYPELVRTMILKLEDDAYDSLLTDIAKLDKDATARKAARLDLRQKELDRKDERRQRATSSEYVKNIRTQITQLVPEDMADDQADAFFDFALHKLERYARQNRGARLQPEQVPALLQELGALDPYGITPNGAGANARSDTSPTSGARSKGPADPELAKKAKRTGQDLTKRVKSRKAAAATAPAGAGSAVAADASPPPNQTFDERMGWLEKRLGLKSK